MSEAKMTRIRIVAYKPPQKQKENPFISDNKIEGGEFVVQANPEQYSMQYTAEYSTKNQAGGKGGYSPKWKKNKPGTLSLDFIFDGTGAIPTYQLGATEKDSDVLNFEQKDVQDSIKKFKEIVINVNYETHEPNYLVIIWGSSLVYYCRLTDMNINYKLFSPDGRPLRATINANFQEVIYNGLDRRKPPTESPDVTHGRTIKDGDALPQMVRQIYGDEYYYLAVAKENKLIQFRNLRPGNSIYFPPIKKN